MVNAVGAKRLSALVRRYLDEGMACEARRHDRQDLRR